MRKKIKEYIAMVTTDSSLGGVAFDGIMELIEENRKEKVETIHNRNFMVTELREENERLLKRIKQQERSLTNLIKTLMLMLILLMTNNKRYVNSKPPKINWLRH